MSARLTRDPTGVGNRNSAKGFTLVELLVVVGIIALLIAILLPSLQEARKSAIAIKCKAALREIGNATLMYASENKQYLPPAKLNGNGSVGYNVYGIEYLSPSGEHDGPTFFSTVNPPYWQSFLSKYVTKSKQGTSAQTASEADLAHRSIFWGCPAWDGYLTGAIGDMNRLQTGLGWNGWPSYEVNYPALNIDYPAAKDIFVPT